MHNNEFSTFFWRISVFSVSFLSILFWIFVIFGFSEPCYAILTVIAAIVHEGGHVVFLYFKDKRRGALRGRLGGLILTEKQRLSYREEILLYASGPLANFAFAIAVLAFAHATKHDNGYGAMLATVNVATGVSNLLPVAGYDGYGIIKNALCFTGHDDAAFLFLPKLSFAIVCAACFFALYLMDRFDGGYWIYSVFFTYLVVATRKTRSL